VVGRLTRLRERLAVTVSAHARNCAFATHSVDPKTLNQHTRCGAARSLSRMEVPDDPETARLVAQLTAPRRPDEARGHHTVSDFYLRRFADDEGWITVIDLTVPTPVRRRRKTSNVSVVNDFYTFINTEGEESPAVERLLSHIEGAAASAMRLVANGCFFPPPERERMDLALWMAFQLVRGTETRRHIEVFADVSQKLLLEGITTPDQARARLRSARGTEATEKEVSDFLSVTTHLDRVEIVPDPNDHIHMMLSMANEIAFRLISMRWLVAQFDEPALLSGDHPMTFYMRPKNYNPLMGIGLETADEVRFPLDPQTMLVMTWEPIKESVFTMPLEGVRDLNQLTLSQAYEFAFMHPDQDHVSGLDYGVRPRPVLHVEGATDGAHSDGANKPPKRVRPKRRRKRR
jgi:Protein of unknown function (DUF4238)